MCKCVLPTTGVRTARIGVVAKRATQPTAAHRATFILAGQDRTARKTSMNARTPRSTVVRTRTAQTRTDHSFVTVISGTNDCPTDVSVSV